MSDFEYANHDTSAQHEGERPAAPTSGLAGLRKQREEIKSKLHLDLAVPRYEGVFVRYRPTTTGQMKRAMDRARSSKDPDAITIANATILAECTIGIFEVGADGEPVGEPDQWQKFDPEFAEYLGVPEVKRAADVVRALFATDGDITATVNRLTEWSGFANDQVVEEYEGN